MPLVQIAGADAGLDRNVQALMTLMVEQDQVQDLIAAARAARPRNPELRAGEQNLAMTFQPFADVQNTPPAMMENIQKVGVENVIVESARFPEAASVIGGLGAAEYRVYLIGCGLEGEKKVYGTGFLVADDLIMTNHHVIEKAMLPFALSGNMITATVGFRSSTSKTELYSLIENDRLVARPSGPTSPIVRKLTNPGFVLRDVTPESLFEVLNEPCELGITSLSQASEIFDKLAVYNSLVSSRRKAVLWHRPEVRDMILESLLATRRGLCERIWRDAAQFYARSSELGDRAEEIYCRMMLDTDPELLFARWQLAVERHLLNSRDELPQRARDLLDYQMLLVESGGEQSPRLAGDVGELRQAEEIDFRLRTAGRMRPWQNTRSSPARTIPTRAVRCLRCLRCLRW